MPQLSRLPDAVLFKELLTLTAAAYAWTLIIGPRELTGAALPILDASDLLLWMRQPESESSSYRTFLDQLAKYHVPHAFVYPVDIPEDNGNGYRFQEEMRQLAHKLKRRTEMARPESSGNVVDQLRQHVQPELLKALEEKPQLEASKTQETVEAFLAKDATLPASREARREILNQVMNDVMGLGAARTSCPGF